MVFRLKILFFEIMMIEYLNKINQHYEEANDLEKFNIYLVLVMH